MMIPKHNTVRAPKDMAGNCHVSHARSMSMGLCESGDEHGRRRRGQTGRVGGVEGMGVGMQKRQINRIGKGQLHLGCMLNDLLPQTLQPRSEQRNHTVIYK